MRGRRARTRRRLRLRLRFRRRRWLRRRHRRRLRFRLRLRRRLRILDPGLMRGASASRSRADAWSPRVSQETSLTAEERRKMAREDLEDKLAVQRLERMQAAQEALLLTAQAVGARRCARASPLSQQPPAAATLSSHLWRIAPPPRPRRPPPFPAGEVCRGGGGRRVGRAGRRVELPRRSTQQTPPEAPARARAVLLAGGRVAGLERWAG